MRNVSSYSRDYLGIDPDDPAAAHIAQALVRLNLSFGFDIEDPGVRERATETGRRQYAHEQNVAKYGTLGAVDRVHVVYYLRVGSLIKVGTTGDLDQRLRAYPPDAVLLATEPGDRKVERRRHQQFAADLDARNEWFRPSADLIGHINSLREVPLTAVDFAA